MCRFLVYKGTEPIRLSDLVTKPIHSITNQTFESRLRFPSSRPFNADGFGIGYYEPGSHSHGAGAGGSGSGGRSVRSSGSSGYEGFGRGRENGSRSGNGKDRKTNIQPTPIETSDPTPPPPLSSHSHSQPAPHPSSSSVPFPPSTISVSPVDDTEDSDASSTSSREEELQIGAERIRGSEKVRRKLESEEEERGRPGLFKSIHPAWSNANLERLAEKIRSPLVFAHVRASTMPGAPSEDNCHPWIFGRLMWMHNGGIADFSLIKRQLQAALTDELFLFPSGYTDSEWAFALFLSKLSDPHAKHFTTLELRTAMLETIKHINALTREVESKTGKKSDPHLLNFVVSDGENVVATRYVSSKTQEASSLFFSSGTTFEEYAEGGHYRMTKADKRENIIMIASEPLTFEQKDWMEVKNNTMVVITPKMNLLQIPIMDDFSVPPETSNCRSSDFAISQGYYVRAPNGTDQVEAL